MKLFKWKIFIYTSIVCLLPIIWGVMILDKLPQSVAIHFDLYGNPDNFAPKGFVVFGLPLLMVLFQAIVCITTDFNNLKHETTKRIEMVSKLIIPCITVVLYIVTLGYGLGWNIDVGKTACAIVGCIFLVLGTCLPKLDYIKNYDIEKEKARKINRFVGYETFIMGLLFLISIFLPLSYRIICLVLLIPYAVIGSVYGIIIKRK